MKYLLQDENGKFILSEEQKLELIEKCKDNSLAKMNPKLALEWDYKNNGDLTPEMITSNSNLKVYWNDSLDRNWLAYISV